MGVKQQSKNAQHRKERGIYYPAKYAGSRLASLAGRAVFESTLRVEPGPLLIRVLYSRAIRLALASPWLDQQDTRANTSKLAHSSEYAQKTSTS